ncbi:MAG: glycosyltransferase family 4 protein [Verrucomicrobiales bacterium]
MSRASVLVAHHWMGRGGSEATAMWTLQALQDDFDVTFVTASPVDWDELNAAYGTRVDPGKIQLLRAPRLPTVDGPDRLVHLQLRCFERFCHRIAPRYDLCVSAYNPIDFGKPSIQLIGDFGFSEEMRKRLYVHGESRFRHRETVMRKAYLALGNLMGIKRRPLNERGDLVLANSEWSAKKLEEFFGLAEAAVLYPPVVLPKAPAGAERDPLEFVCLGRVVPEKEIERIVGILEAVRGRGFPVTLRFIGNLDDSAYARRVAQLIGDRAEWITPEGFLALGEKQAILARPTYALHACRIEAFGIAVAEMASMGCVPFVPSTGGAGEIVGDPRLQFDDDEEAVEKIVRLLRSPEDTAAIRRELPGEMNRFGPKIFMEEIRRRVRDFRNPDPSGIHDATEENLATVG